VPNPYKTEDSVMQMLALAMNKSNTMHVLKAHMSDS